MLPIPPRPDDCAYKDVSSCQMGDTGYVRMPLGRARRSGGLGRMEQGNRRLA